MSDSGTRQHGQGKAKASPRDNSPKLIPLAWLVDVSCPCGSTDLKNYGTVTIQGSGHRTTRYYRCQACGQAFKVNWEVKPLEWLDSKGVKISSAGRKSPPCASPSPAP